MTTMHARHAAVHTVNGIVEENVVVFVGPFIRLVYCVVILVFDLMTDEANAICLDRNEATEKSGRHLSNSHSL